MVKKWKQWQILFSWAPKLLQMVTLGMNLKGACSLDVKYVRPRQCIKKQRYNFADKSLYSQSCGFSSSRVQLWKLDHKEGWVLKNWCFWTVVLETLESPLDCKEIKPVYSKRKSTLNIFWKGWYWSSNTLATWCWERLKPRGEGDDRGWDGWMASPTQWPWVWGNSGRWWRTGKPGVLQSMGSRCSRVQRVGHGAATEQQQYKSRSVLSTFLHQGKSTWGQILYCEFVVSQLIPSFSFFDVCGTFVCSFGNYSDFAAFCLFSCAI